MKTTLEWTEDIVSGAKVITLTIAKEDMFLVKLDNFDKALLNEINTDKNSKISDKLLGIETLVRRIEEQS